MSTKTYSDFIDLEVSEKVVLCWIEPTKKEVLFTLHSGSVYKKTVDYFAINVREGATDLAEGASASLNSGEWYYDPETSILYVRSSDDSDPAGNDLSVDYRLFFGNGPFNLPYDLTRGSADVEYIGSLTSNSPIKKELDEEQVGIALESNSTIVLNNADGYFDDLFDRYYFEYKRVRLYSWSPIIPLSEKKLIFDGIIHDKTFNESSVSFSLKDFVYKLRKNVQLEVFSASDGDVPDTYLNTPKRRIYGKFDKLRCVPVDATLSGYTLTGTVSSTSGSTTLSGSGTSFLDEVSPDDELSVVLANGNTITVSVDTVISDTSLTVATEFENTFSGLSCTNEPTRPWRKKNRSWHIAGHKLREPTTTVSSIVYNNRFVLTDATDFYAGDKAIFGSEYIEIKRVNGNEVLLIQNLQNTPSASDPVSVSPVSAAYFGSNTAVLSRDFTVTNGANDAILVFGNDAEFNAATEKTMGGTYTFTNGGRSIAVSGIDPRPLIQTRDWIRSDETTHTTFYEVLSVGETSITIRTPYGGTNGAYSAFRKTPALIDDNTVVCVDCFGLENSGEWTKNASRAVEHLLQNDAGLTNLNASSFATADSEAQQWLSIATPENIGGGFEEIKTVISKINKSVFGSLINNTDWEAVYNILSQEKPTDLLEIEDDDIIGSFTARTNNNIVAKVRSKYRPFVDIFTGENSFKFTTYTNSGVTNYIGATEEMNLDLFLYNDNDADTITQRYALYNSLSQSQIRIKTKLSLALHNLNDKLRLSLDRLYKRFGSTNRSKIGIINKIEKDGADVTVEINDLGNTFNRVLSIAENTANDFNSATNNEKIVNCYIVDNINELPDNSSDDEANTQIIG